MASQGGFKVSQFHVNSSIHCRFATTKLCSVLENIRDEAQEAEFKAVLPNAAFITEFVMEVGGKVYVGDVKEKKEAKFVYDTAKYLESPESNSGIREQANSLGSPLDIVSSLSALRGALRAAPEIFQSFFGKSDSVAVQDNVSPHSAIGSGGWAAPQTTQSGFGVAGSGRAIQGFSPPSPLMTAEQRLRKELLNWQNESDLHADGFKADPLKHADGSLNLFKWSIVIPGKKGTPWENGCFPMTMVFSNDYPKLPPKSILGIFDPQLFHPNIGADGVVNFSFLDANNGWHQVATTKQILLLIQKLLTKPSIDCANNPDALELFRLNPAEYEDKIRKQTQRFSPAASSSN